MKMVNSWVSDKGIIQLAIRSGQFKTINVTDVREGELVNFDLLSGRMEFNAIEGRIDLPIIGYVAYFELVNGFSKSLYMTMEEIDRHAQKYSQTYSSKNDYVKKSSKWVTDFDAMARKTVIKLLLSRFAPMSVEMQEAVKFDQSVQRDANMPTYVDNEEETYAEEIKETATTEITEGEVTELIKVASKIATKGDFEQFVEMNEEAVGKSERFKSYVDGRMMEFNEKASEK